MMRETYWQSVQVSVPKLKQKLRLHAESKLTLGRALGNEHELLLTKPVIKFIQTELFQPMSESH